MAGSLAHRQKRAETGDVRAERRGCVGMGPEAAWGVLGMHVGRGNGADGHAQVGLLVRLTLVPVNCVIALVRAYLPGGRRWMPWVGVPGPQPPLGPRKAAASAIWKLRPPTQLRRAW